MRRDLSALSAQVETIAGALDEMKPLIAAHFAALALDPAKAPLDPQYDLYLELERRGEMVMATLRDEGELVGYVLGFIAPGLHYRRTLTFVLDALWVREDRRNRAGGLKLMRRLLKELKRRGVERAFLGSKRHDDCGRLFEAFGARPVETHYSLWIGD
jgi:GNAT superfamily N-acetyltransferase